MTPAKPPPRSSPTSTRPPASTPPAPALPSHRRAPEADRMATQTEARHWPAASDGHLGETVQRGESSGVPRAHRRAATATADRRASPRLLGISGLEAAVSARMPMRSPAPLRHLSLRDSSYALPMPMPTEKAPAACVVVLICICRFCASCGTRHLRSPILRPNPSSMPSPNPPP